MPQWPGLDKAHGLEEAVQGHIQATPPRPPDLRALIFPISPGQFLLTDSRPQVRSRWHCVAFVISGAGLATCPPLGTEASRVAQTQTPAKVQLLGRLLQGHIQVFVLSHCWLCPDLSPWETMDRRQSSQGTLPIKLTSPALTLAVKTPREERRPPRSREWEKARGLQPSFHPDSVLSESSGDTQTLSGSTSFTGGRGAGGRAGGASVDTPVLSWLWEEEGVASQDSLGTGRWTVYQALSKHRPLHPKDTQLQLRDVEQFAQGYTARKAAARTERAETGQVGGPPARAPLS